MRQLPGCQRRSHEAFGTDGANQHIRAGMIHQQWIGQDIHAVEIDEHRRMAKPGGRDAVGIPALGCRCKIGLEDFSTRLSNQAARCAGGQAIRDPCADATLGTNGGNPLMTLRQTTFFQTVLPCNG